jgi:hypothetical protein
VRGNLAKTLRATIEDIFGASIETEWSREADQPSIYEPYDVDLMKISRKPMVFQETEKVEDESRQMDSNFLMTISK